MTVAMKLPTRKQTIVVAATLAVGYLILFRVGAWRKQR